MVKFTIDEIRYVDISFYICLVEIQVYDNVAVTSGGWFCCLRRHGGPSACGTARRELGHYYDIYSCYNVHIALL